ncbi:MAG: HD domain-containing protein [Oscillospiraceae bacterium]|nr:HD domain-containing protein [Oscillospiraceae bacterium]
MELLQQYQLDIMLMLCSVCALLGVFVLMNRTVATERKHALIAIELGSSFLLASERFAYLYRGGSGTFAYYAVRVSNFLVYASILFVIAAFNKYLRDLFTHEGRLPESPKQLGYCKLLTIVGVVMLIISQFTGLYYTFDSSNRYQRAGGFLICYIIPLLISVFQLAVIIKYYKRLRFEQRIPLLLFTVVPIIAGIVQIFVYGLSLFSMSIVGMAILLYVFTLIDTNDAIDRANRREIEVLREEQGRFKLLFTQTAEALASAIDAKDKYTHGHSRRVAEYSEQIARSAGMPEESVEQVYFAALLHDVGKIGIADQIINKEGKLTDAEFAEIKKHPEIGDQILSSISGSPYLSLGAKYHHERYDGRGYPHRLKGDDIPAIARIIAVADAYDAMTSKRSYRAPMPQQLVREELVKGMGAQFDPVYSKLMLHLIDLDSEYQMKERAEFKELVGRSELVCAEYRSAFSHGMLITEKYTDISLECYAKPHSGGLPSLILFDSLDGLIHLKEHEKKDLIYTEYGEIRFDGTTVCTAARKMKVDITPHPHEHHGIRTTVEYEIRAAHVDDHMLIRITSEQQTVQIIVALPDASRYAYLALSGEHCELRNVKLSQSEESLTESDIPRIADKISYIDVPAGDLPNIQVDGWRSTATEGVPVRDGMKILFHGKSLPTARLVWHCPFLVLFSADDRKVNGENYREYALIRLDGECWESDTSALNKIQINMNDDFVSWDAWKALNKNGMECEASIRREGNTIAITTENGGIALKNVTMISSDITSEILVALTGDQCAVTNIRIR